MIHNRTPGDELMSRNTAWLSGIDGQEWENVKRPGGCANTTAGANPQLDSTGPRSAG